MNANEDTELAIAEEHRQHLSKEQRKRLAWIEEEENG